MKRIQILLTCLFFVSIIYGQVENEDFDFDMQIQMSGGQVGERLKLSHNYKLSPTEELFLEMKLKVFIQKLNFHLNSPDMKFEFKTLKSIKNTLISNAKLLESYDLLDRMISSWEIISIDYNFHLRKTLKLQNQNFRLPINSSH